LESETGFTLAELLVTVVIVALIGAVVFPNLLRSRVAAGESAAVSSVREVNKAEIVYETTYPAIGFASALAILGTGSSDAACSSHTADHACLLEYKLSNATSPEHARNGYSFLVTPTSKDSSRVVTGYLVGSAAAIFNESGVRDFCSTEDGVLHFRVPHQQSTPMINASECHDSAVLQ
jgi:prepilin-type N-terminal cleavage/methylation domain-containing protein